MLPARRGCAQSVSGMPEWIRECAFAVSRLTTMPRAISLLLIACAACSAPEEGRAFRQEREADLVLTYERPSDLPDLLPPGVRSAVVIFSKRAEWDDALMDAIEARFRAQGCPKVIFQLHQGKKILGEPDPGRPILRE